MVQAKGKGGVRVTPRVLAETSGRRREEAGPALGWLTPSPSRDAALPLSAATGLRESMACVEDSESHWCSVRKSWREEKQAPSAEGRAGGLAAGCRQSWLSCFFPLFTAVYSGEKRSKALRVGTSERQNTCD